MRLELLIFWQTTLLNWMCGVKNTQKSLVTSASCLQYGRLWLNGVVFELRVSRHKKPLSADTEWCTHLESFPSLTYVTNITKFDCAYWKTGIALRFNNKFLNETVSFIRISPFSPTPSNSNMVWLLFAWSSCIRLHFSIDLAQYRSISVVEQCG